MIDKPNLARNPKWDGPRAYLHLREVNGVPCLFDDQERMISSVRRLGVETEMFGHVVASVEVLLARPPSLEVADEVDKGGLAA